jgi:hypothetical protein
MDIANINTRNTPDVLLEHAPHVALRGAPVDQRVRMGRTAWCVICY